MTTLQMEQDLPAGSPDWAYFLDLDGTLVHHAPSPSQVLVDQPLLDLLGRLNAGSAVALISGRSIADIDRMLAPHCLALAGQHGVERRDAQGRMHHHVPDAHVLQHVRERLACIAEAIPGTLLEDKGASLALHYRNVPEAEPAVTTHMAQLAREAGHGYCLQTGKMVLEIRPTGRDKGIAIAEFLEEAPFRGRRPVFIGDDDTDEYGFETVNARGGITVKVGPGRTAAKWRLADADAVRAWLGAALSSLAEHY